MQSWNFAASSNNDNLLSAVGSAVDQLLKLLSNHIDLREQGLLLGRTLLQQAQLRILSRGIASPKHKEHIIGPCLRILKEIVTFDGGTLARQLYAKRDLAFDPQTIARCLTYRRLNVTEPEDIIKKPTVRTTAIRYVLANFKFQDDGAKADMLKQGNMMRMLVNGIEGDHPKIILEILRSLTRDVIQDPGIPRRNKGFLFNDRNLLSLCQLYRTNFTEEESDNQRPFTDEIHDFMVTATTSPDAGVMRASGWYPPTNDDETLDFQQSADSAIDLGLDGITWYNKFNKHIPIRNQSLGDLILTLRPYAYEQERQLLLAIFEATPELVAWFYQKMTPNFPFMPKLTATWIGYAAALFSTIQLPVPTLYNRMSHLPPPVSIMIESVLPAPLDQKTLRQCLSNKSDLIRFFALRILVVSFTKLKDVLSLLREKASSDGKLWEEATTKLIDEFLRRCPTLQDITKLYGTLRNATGENAMQREATLRLMALFHEVLPQAALEGSYDVSIPLTGALQDIEEANLEGDEAKLRRLDLNHLVKIAGWSSSMHWMGKTKGLKSSPLVTLLRLLVKAAPGAVKDIKQLVTNILEDGDAIQVRKWTLDAGAKASALDALVVSLRLRRTGEQLTTSDAIYAFLDKCFHRYSTRPIKYEDDKDALLNNHPADEAGFHPCSLIPMTILEQWPFVQEDKVEVGHWINDLFRLLNIVNDPLAHAALRSQVFVNIGLSKYDPASDDGSRNDELATCLSGYVNTEEGFPSEDTVETPIEQNSTSMESGPVIDLSSFAPPPEPESHAVLTRYRKKDLETLLDDGSLGSLIQCLTSPHLSIRMQAFTALRSIMTSLETSTHVDKDMLYLLHGELLETCVDNEINEKPMADIAIAFAAKAVDVLKDPTHALYVKVNDFLNRGPIWRVRSMCAYWLEQVLLHPPGDADTEGAYWREVVWVLEWLVDGLRTNDNFDIMRRNSVFEKTMALFFHAALDRRRFVELVVDTDALAREPSLQAKIRPLILRLVARAALVGGATVLITGAGVLAWLKDVKSLVASEKRASKVVEDIEKAILQHADQEKIRDWSGGVLAQMAETG
jgi:nucleolar pre-ribosomal-associated protein 1